MTDQEINEAVARKLGWTKKSFEGRKGFWFKPNYNLPNNIPYYCNSIEAAWEVVEWIRINFPEEILRLECVGNEWEFGPTMMCGDEEFISDTTNGRADTAPMAICLAFLKLEDK